MFGHGQIADNRPESDNEIVIGMLNEQQARR
jgi:hypothetical protein